jgi:DNA-binding transcriptional LysR family regulator
MNLEQLSAFLTVVEEHGFTAASKRLNGSQSAISRQVQSLERELGTRLLVRTPQGVVMTDAGERFVVYARRAVESLRAGATALEELSGVPRGQVSLSTLPTVGAYLLPGLLQTYHRRYPEVQLRVAEALPEALEEGVARGDFDLAILNLPLRRLDLVAQKLWQEEFVLAVPKGHRLAPSSQTAPTRKKLTLADVVGEGLVVIRGVSATIALQQAHEDAGERMHVVLETDNPESVRRMVERGLGVALLPSIIARDKEKLGKGFEVVELAQGGPHRQVALIHRGEGYLNAAARALKTMIVETLRR